MYLQLNHSILVMITGAILLAAVYHTILFAHNRLRLIGYYAMYLWSAAVYCLVRSVYFHGFTDEHFWLMPDETLQMICFALYIHFTKNAMELRRDVDRFSWRFCTIAPYVIATHIILYSALHQLSSRGIVSWNLTFIPYLGVRLFLLVTGFTGFMVTMRRRNNLYYKYILYAIFAIIFTGLLATIIEIFWKYTSPVGPLTTLTLGFAIDAAFFSAAIAYKMRMETMEKEAANLKVLEQELALQKAEMARMEASYKAKEEERSRIATELHDEIGSTLSSISILSDVITHEKNETSLRTMQEEIRDNSKVMMEKMDDIIFSLNPRNDSMEKMLLRLRQFATPLFEAKGIDYHFSFDDALYALPVAIETRQQLYLILKEALNNVMKHSACSSASFMAKIEDGTAAFIISDNGKGFNTEAAYEGNGLLNMRTRAQKITAALSLHSTPYEATTLVLTINSGLTTERTE